MLMKKHALPIPRPSLRHLCPPPLAFSAVLAAFITFADAAVGGIFFVAPSTATYGWGSCWLDRHCPMGSSSGRDVMRKSAGPSLCMTLRGGGKHKEKRHVSGEPQETVNAIYAEHFPVADGHERKEKDTEKHFKDILQEKLRSKDKDEVLVNDEEEDDERFSYMKVSEAEMRRAEEREAQREREFQEHQEKKRMGLVVDENTEVIDTLRWPSAQDNFSREGAKKGQQQRGRRETEEEVVLAGGERHSLAHENEQELTVNEWLEKNGLAQYASTFETEGWDNLDAIHTMTEQDMLEIGVKRGHVRRLMLAMGREPPPMRMESMSRSVGRGASYARNERYGYEGSQARTSQARMSQARMSQARGPRYQDDYGYNRNDNRNDNTHHWRNQADRENGLKANVKTQRHGPGGSSRLTEAGGLGAFLMGGDADEEDNFLRDRR